MTSLYRHFDVSGRLLYVGISATPLKRTSCHARGSAWFGDIARITVEHHETREAALLAERNAILTESPRHNRKIPRRAADRPLRSAPMDCFIKVRVTDKEKQAFLAAADTSGKPLSEIIRAALDRLVKKVAK